MAVGLKRPRLVPGQILIGCDPTFDIIPERGTQILLVGASKRLASAALELSKNKGGVGHTREHCGERHLVGQGNARGADQVGKEGHTLGSVHAVYHPEKPVHVDLRLKRLIHELRVRKRVGRHRVHSGWPSAERARRPAHQRMRARGWQSAPYRGK